MRIKRVLGWLAGAVMVFSMTIITPLEASAAGCAVTTPNIHFSTTEIGRLNFKPFVRCTTPEVNQLYLSHRVQYKSGDAWVTTVWTKNVLNSGLSYVRVSLSRTCVPGTFRGQARYMGDSGFWSDWKTSNIFVVASCSGGGSWLLPIESPHPE